MHRNRVVAIISRRSLIIGTLGALVLLWGVLSGCQANEAIVETAIAQTAAAQTEIAAAETEDANELSTAVAAEFAAQAGAGGGGESSSGISVSAIEVEAGTTGQECPNCDQLCDEQQCDTRVAEEVETRVVEAINATATQRTLDFERDATRNAALTRIAEEDEDGDGGGGPGEVAACERGDYPTCATNISDGNVVVRTGPGTQWPSVTVLVPDDTVPVKCVLQNDWLNIIWSVELKRDGWVSGEFMDIEGKDPEICTEIPPTPFPTVTLTPTPTPTPATPTATPVPEIVFTASRTTLSAGESSELAWKVENVKEVYLYPVGANWQDFPVEGEGTKLVRPFVTTTYQLRVIRNDGSTVFSDIEIQVSGGLTTGTWRLRAYEDLTGTLQTVIPNSNVTARFDVSNVVSGFGGCNTYSGGYQAYDETLHVTSLTATNAACANDIMQQEAGFLSAMQRANSMVISFNELTVRDGSGRTILSFIR